MKRRTILAICLMIMMATRLFATDVLGQQTPVPPEKKPAILDELNKMESGLKASKPEVIKQKGNATDAEKGTLDIVLSKIDAILDNAKKAISAVDVSLEALNATLTLIQDSLADLEKEVKEWLDALIIATVSVRKAIATILKGIFALVATTVKGLTGLIGELLKLPIEIIKTPYYLIKALLCIFPKNTTNKLGVSVKPPVSGASVKVRYAINDTIATQGVTDHGGTLSLVLPFDVYFIESGYGKSNVFVLDGDLTFVLCVPVGDAARKVLFGGGTLMYLYPATTTTGKLPGVGAAAPSDIYAAAGALQGAGGIGYVQGWDNDASKVDLVSGRPLTGAHTVMTGGPAVHNSIKYYMDLAPSGADQSPAFFRMHTVGGVTYYQFILRATSAVIVNVPASDVTGLQRDLALVQSFTDASGRVIFIATGLTLKGTQAGALWFVKSVMANPSAYTGSVYVIGWNDASTPWTIGGVTLSGGNNDGFVDYTEIRRIYG